MDPVAMTYYATVCGVLTLVGPKLGAPPLRFGVGVCVGLVAAGLLPLVRRWLGLG